MSSIRTLPIRLAPIEGESIDSWLEAIADRTHTAFGDLLHAVGLPARKPSGDGSWILRLTSDEREALTLATGTSPSFLDSMTLSTYFGRAIYVDTPVEALGRGFLWGRGSGSRFCPMCLSDNSGRWQLKWRLRWAFACTTHHCLLIDACASCGSVQRNRPHIGRFVPQPSLCAARAPQARNHQRCGGDLTTIQPAMFDPQHPVMRAQRVVDEVIAAETATFGVYANHPQPRMNVLADIRAIAGRALRYGAPEDMAEHVPADLLKQYHLMLAEAELVSGGMLGPGLRVPARTITAAVGVVAALSALDSPSIPSSAAALRWLVAASRERGHVVSATNVGWGRRSSPVLVGIQLKSLERFLKPSDQLRYGIASHLPARPRTVTTAKCLAARLPTALWPVWSLRFAIPHCDQRHLRMGLSASVLLIGRRITLTECVSMVDSSLTGGAVSRILQLLQHQEQWCEIRAGMTKMATYLEQQAPPIDYRRRRCLDYSDLLPVRVWVQICRDTGSTGAHQARALVARCFLYERLSGRVADTAPFADDTTHFRRATNDFAGHMTKELSGLLYEYGTHFLQAQGIYGEPATWQPPVNVLQGMRLPGFDPACRGTTLLDQFASGSTRISKISKELQIDVDVARYLAELNPATPPAWVTSSAPRPPRLGAYRAAKSALPADRFAELYNRRRMSLADIAANAGVSKPVISRLAREYGVEVATPGPKVKHPFEREWLTDQYVNRQRSLPEIAAETGVSITTVARWAKTFGIPLRSQGGGSHTAVRKARATSSEAPEFLKSVLAAPNGWKWLQRFAAAVDYPTLTTAAKHLGVRQSVLTQQITRIERELGMQLLERAERGRPMAVTTAGRRVLDAIEAFNRDHAD
ncbi:TniQ family protein [Mycolicibacterium obuense]|uniref:TniQ family protein n=1 Tax=Mycolicibacterium obuense TaxID=1807 RepID=UPI0023F822AC|nr:TniQ family protein [Mycolicibacterium obuense]